MNNIASALQDLFYTKPEEGEYVHPQTGMLWCNHCQTPRQIKIELGGQTYAPRIQCRCQSEQFEAEHSRLRQQEFEDRIARNRGLGMQEAALRLCRFERSNADIPEIKRAKAYAEHWQEMQENAMGLLLWGDVGTCRLHCQCAAGSWCVCADDQYASGSQCADQL